MPTGGIAIYPKQGCFGYFENGFVLFFCVSAFLYSFCFQAAGFLGEHTGSPLRPDCATLFSFGRYFSPTPFLIIRTKDERVKKKL
jgi:hypothetical protein